MDREELKSELIGFGLTKSDSEVFLALLQYGSRTARQVSSLLGMHRGLVYQSLNRLKNMNMIEMTFSNPAKFYALELDSALSNLVSKKKYEYDVAKKLAKRIKNQVSDLALPEHSTKEPTLSILQGRTHIYSKMGQIIENSSNDVFIISTLFDFMRMYYTSIPEKIALCKKRGGMVRILTEPPSQDQIPILEKLGANEIRIRKNLKTCRILIEEKGEVMMSADMQYVEKSNNQSDSMLYTNSPDILENTLALYQVIWKRAVPLSEYYCNVNVSKRSE